MLTNYQDGQFIYTQDNLAGAVYEIHAAADIATPDRQGTYWYKSGDLVATVTTGAEGQVDEVKFSPTRTQATYDFLTVSHDGTKGEVTVTLPLGKYTITEVQAPYGFVLTQQSYTVEFGWDNQKNDIVLAKTIVSHEQDGDKECSYSIVNVKDASDAHKNGQTLVFENARVLPVPEKPGDKVSKIGVGIYKKDREALTYLAGAVYELYTVDDIFSADGTKLLDAGAKLAESSPTNESGFTWFDVDIPIRAKTYPDSGNSGRYRIVEITAPAGYLLDSTPMEVSFTYEGQQIAWQVVDATNTNLRTSVDISKQDITNGKELPGAKLEIRAADGNLVEGWTSTKTPHTVRDLELEKAYTLTETRAPDGYTEAESIVFKLVQNGTEQVNSKYESDLMIYTQLIQTLYRQADRIHKGRLPVPVHCLMDEYANLSLPKDTFLSALATMRSRGIFCSIIVQNMAQLKAMYKDDWESLVGLCDEFLYLGGTEKETHKYVSELLGKETISTTSYNQSKGRSGSYSINHQQSGRDLMTPDEVRLLDNSKCILFIRGERPVVDLKYNLLKHPNIRYTEDGGAAPYDYTAADNALDDLPGAPENYELLDIDDFLPAEAAEMKPTIQRIRRPK